MKPYNVKCLEEKEFTETAADGNICLKNKWKREDIIIRELDKAYPPQFIPDNENGNEGKSGTEENVNYTEKYGTKGNRKK